MKIHIGRDPFQTWYELDLSEQEEYKKRIVSRFKRYSTDDDDDGSDYLETILSREGHCGDCICVSCTCGFCLASWIFSICSEFPESHQANLLLGVTREFRNLKGSTFSNLVLAKLAVIPDLSTPNESFTKLMINDERNLLENERKLILENLWYSSVPRWTQEYRDAEKWYREYLNKHFFESEEIFVIKEVFFDD